MFDLILGEIAKYDPQLDFKHKSITKLELNEKIIQKTSDISQSLINFVYFSELFW